MMGCGGLGCRQLTCRQKECHKIQTMAYVSKSKAFENNRRLLCAPRQLATLEQGNCYKGLSL